MKEIEIFINGKSYYAPAGMTILEAARLHDIEIPTLCFLKEINEIGACRICVVEVEGIKNLVTACVYPIQTGMKIKTNSQRVFKSRKLTLKLILSTHERNVYRVFATAIVNYKGCVKSLTLMMKTITTVKIRNTPLTIVRFTWCVIIISAFCVNAVLQLVKNARQLV